MNRNIQGWITPYGFGFPDLRVEIPRAHDAYPVGLDFHQELGIGTLNSNMSPSVESGMFLTLRIEG